MIHTRRRINCPNSKGSHATECLLWLKIRDNTTNVENYDGELVNKAIKDLECEVLPTFCKSKVLWSGV